MDKDRIIVALRPYRDVIIFMVTLLVANYLWKFTFVGDEDGEMVTWLGMDVTAPFEWMACHITAVVYWLVSLFRETAFMVGDQMIKFQSGSATKIIWGCTALKQSFIWLCLVLTIIPNGGSNKQLWLSKLWFIPFGWLCCYLFNILRIFIITLFLEYHPDSFELLHSYIFKYLFYGMLFLLWVWFVEKIRVNAEPAQA